MLLVIDIGFRANGWVVYDKGKIKDCGCIRTQKTKVKTTRVSDDNAYCAGLIAREVEKVVVTYKCQAVIGELPTGGSLSARAANQMGIALGVIAGIVELLNLPVEWISPGDVKMAVVGTRKASKDQMMDEIKKLYPNTTFPKTKAEFEHIADACGAYVASAGSNLVKIYG